MGKSRLLYILIPYMLGFYTHATDCTDVFLIEPWQVGRSPIPVDDWVEKGTFNQQRALDTYRQIFGDSFSRRLEKLDNGTSTWIDFGAGSARAQRTYGVSRFRKEGQMPRLIAVGYRIPGKDRADIKRYQRHSKGKLIYVEGAQDSQTVRQFPEADLITDLFGLVSYAKPFDRLEMIQSYIDRLKPGGKIFIYSNSEIFLEIHRPLKRIERERPDLHVQFRLRQLIITRDKD